MRIAARLFGEWMLDERAVDVAGLNHALDQLEILPRLLLVPRCGSWREGHEVERRVVDRVTNGTARMAFPFFQEDRLYLVLEELVTEGRPRSGRSSLAL